MKYKNVKARKEHTKESKKRQEKLNDESKIKEEKIFNSRQTKIKAESKKWHNKKTGHKTKRTKENDTNRRKEI